MTRKPRILIPMLNPNPSGKVPRRPDSMLPIIWFKEPERDEARYLQFLKLISNPRKHDTTTH